jgi:hypothetical protein
MASSDRRSTTGAWMNVRARANARGSAAMLLASALLAIAALAGSAAAFTQPASAGPTGTTGQAAGEARGLNTIRPVDPDEYLARWITRIALLDVRLATTPAVNDYRFTALLLDLASRFRPNDDDLVRRRLEAAFGAGDDAMIEAATRRLVELDPKDTVAQLRLISRRIGALQTAEARLGAYDRFLSAEGAGLDASIRSRLALDAALLHRERGEEAKFAERLALASTLDPTNKEAALIAMSHASERGADPIARLELVSNLLLADPIDPMVHLQLARDLAALGDYAGANRFHDIAQSMIGGGGARPDRQFSDETWCIEWADMGPENVLRRMTLTLADQRFQAEEEKRRAADDIAATGRVQDPRNVRLASELERIRLICADAVGDRASVEQSAQDFAASFDQVYAEIQDPAKFPEQLTLEVAEEFRWQSFVELQVLRLWMGVDVDKIEPDIQRYPLVKLDETHPYVRIMRGWQALRAGDFSKAEEILSTIETPDEFDGLPIPPLELPTIGLAMSAELQGRQDKAILLYREVLRRRPTELAGVWSRTRLQNLGDRDEEALRLKAAAEKISGGIPRDVDRAVGDPTTFMRLEFTPERTTLGAYERNVLTLRIRNMSRFPLAVGSDKAVSSRMLFMPAVEVTIDSLPPELTQAEIIEVDRRLRLMPREELTVKIWPDAGVTGALTEAYAAQVMRLRYRAVQGFAATGAGGFDATGLGLTADSPLIVRTADAMARTPIGDFAAKLGSGRGALTPEFIGALRARLLSRGIDGQMATSEQRAALAAALASFYPNADAPTRRMLLAALPNRATMEEMLAFDEATLAETDPAALAIIIATRVIDASSPAIDRALASDDATLKSLAAIQRERLTAQSRIFANSDAMSVLITGVAEAMKAPTEAQSPTTPEGTPPTDPTGVAPPPPTSAPGSPPR